VRAVMRATDSSSHGGGNDDDEGDDDPNDPISRPIPRHPFLDGLEIARRRRDFFASEAHGPGAVVKRTTVMVRCCAICGGGRGTGITAVLEQIDIVSFLARCKR